MIAFTEGYQYLCCASLMPNGIGCENGKFLHRSKSVPLLALVALPSLIYRLLLRAAASPSSQVLYYNHCC